MATEKGRNITPLESKILAIVEKMRQFYEKEIKPTKSHGCFWYIPVEVNREDRDTIREWCKRTGLNDTQAGLCEKGKTLNDLLEFAVSRLVDAVFSPITTGRQKRDAWKAIRNVLGNDCNEDVAIECIGDTGKLISMMVNSIRARYPDSSDVLDDFLQEATSGKIGLPHDHPIREYYKRYQKDVNHPQKMLFFIGYSYDAFENALNEPFSRTQPLALIVSLEVPYGEAVQRGHTSFVMSLPYRDAIQIAAWMREKNIRGSIVKQSTGIKSDGRILTIEPSQGHL